MEVLVQHELMDIIRIEQGIIVEIHKFEYQKGWVYTDGDIKKKLKKLSGIKYGYKVKEPFEYRGDTYKVGDYIINHLRVKPIKDKNLYKIELKCSGGSIRKSFEHMEGLFDTITKYIETNY